MKIPLKYILILSKKYLLLSVVTAVVIASRGHFINAQVLIGPKLGTKLSWLSYDEPAREEYKGRPFLGYSAGITTDFKVKKRFHLQFDVAYARQGKSIVGVGDPTLENKTVFHYLNTPIIYKMDFIESLWGREFKWFVGAGPNINFWLKGNGTIKSVELYEVNISSLDYKILFGSDSLTEDANTLYLPDANRMQVGLLFTSGLVFEPRPNQAIFIELRFEYGHSYLAKGSGRFRDVTAYEDDYRARNQSFQLSVSYLFDLFPKGKNGKKIYFD